MKDTTFLLIGLVLGIGFAFLFNKKLKKDVERTLNKLAVDKLNTPTNSSTESESTTEDEPTFVEGVVLNPIVITDFPIMTIETITSQNLT